MAKHFRPWNPKQKWLLPPEITDFIPEGHASHFVRDLVVEQSLGHVALDGTKVKANASKHKAMSYDRMVKAENEFAEVVKGWLDQAEITDLGEDARFRNRKGDELPDWVVNKVERQKRIREAKAALEKEAADRAKAEMKADDEEPPEPPKVDPKAQRNFTDPESRIMPTKNGFEQCFNAQAAVDAEAQVIVACDVVATSADCPQLLPMVDRIKANLGRKPRVCSADAGYCSEKNLEGMATRKIKTYIATGRQKHGTKAATHAKNGKEGSLISTNAGEAKTRWLAKPLSPPETGGRARIWPDQARHGFSAVPSTGAGQGSSRMVSGLHRP